MPALGGFTAMLLKLALVLINLCVNDQRNLIHSLKNYLPRAQEKVVCLFILEKLMNKTNKKRG